MSKYFCAVFALFGSVLLGISAPASAYTKDAATEIARQVFKNALHDINLFTEESAFFGDQAGLTVRERYLLHGIVVELGEHGWPTLSFDSETLHPGTFQIDGAVRLAKTGSEPRDPIIVNEDLIVEEDPFNGYQPPAFLRAVAILTHEFGHHFLRDEELDWHEFPVPGPITHEELDVLGNKVAVFMETRAQRAVVGAEVNPALGGGAEITFETYLSEGGSGPNDYNYGSQAGIYVRGPFGYIALAGPLAHLTRCPKETIDGVEYSGSPISIYFERFQKIGASERAGRVVLTLTIPEAHVNCLQTETQYDSFGPYKDGTLSLFFNVTPAGVTYDQHASTLDITVPADIVWQRG